jgi:hypothetical protein
MLTGNDYYDGSHEEVTLIKKSIRWNLEEPGRYEHLTEEELLEAVRDGSISPKTIAIIQTTRGMLNDDRDVADRNIRNLMGMEAQNQRDELVEKEKPEEPNEGKEVHVTVNNNNQVVTVQQVVSEVMKDDSYLNFLRSQAIEEDSNSNLVRSNNTERLSVSKTQSLPRSNSNGSSNGQDRKSNSNS